jgi:hypothetical protein
MDTLTEYLSKPCDDCEHTATHNGFSRSTGQAGRFCNAHIDRARSAHARND